MKGNIEGKGSDDHYPWFYVSNTSFSHPCPKAGAARPDGARRPTAGTIAVGPKYLDGPTIENGAPDRGAPNGEIDCAATRRRAQLSSENPQPRERGLRP
jgi:hypothetical protein